MDKHKIQIQQLLLGNKAVSQIQEVRPSKMKQI